MLGYAIFLFINKNNSDDKINDDAKQVDTERYMQIKSDIDKEMQRYLYVIAPNCSSDNAGGFLTHKDLVMNNGFDKEKLLDIDNKSYCKAYIKYKCVEDGKWDWKTTISCINYTGEDYKDWADPFPNKD